MRTVLVLLLLIPFAASADDDFDFHVGTVDPRPMLVVQGPRGGIALNTAPAVADVWTSSAISLKVTGVRRSVWNTFYRTFGEAASTTGQAPLVLEIRSFGFLLTPLGNRGGIISTRYVVALKEAGTGRVLRIITGSTRPKALVSDSWQHMYIDLLETTFEEIANQLFPTGALPVVDAPPPAPPSSNAPVTL